MKAEISNIADQDAKRFTSVVYQLARMRTDWDDNASEQIRKNLLDGVSLTALGSGTPSHHGMIIQTQAGDDPMQLAVSATGGKVVADGVVGRLVVRTGDDASEDPGAYVNQSDLHLFGTPALQKTNLHDQSYVLYADIWDRTVTAFDDEDLLDVALHGADTTGRERRCTQLKIAKAGDLLVAGSDPCNPSFRPDRIPATGNGIFNLALNDKTIAPDDCDPCASEVDIDEEVGNHLFRLEVHHVKYGGARRPNRLIFKYSKENGARRFASDVTPEPEFVYEHFSGHAGQLLGMPSDDWIKANLYDPDGTTPSLRGIFRRTAHPDLEFVRRWDGYIDLELNAGTWEILAAVHGDGVPTSSGVADGILTLVFDGMTLTLALENKSFLAGDTWYALLRNRAPGDQQIKVVSETPFGVRHHYCILGMVEAEGGKLKVVEDGTINLLDGALTAHDRRRLQFPSLTCLGAEDVGYEADCPSGLFGPDEDNVSKALDKICRIQAEHVGFTPDCAYLADKKVTNVDEALEALCERSVNVDCAVKVRPDGRDVEAGIPDEWRGLPTLREALAAHKERVVEFENNNGQGPRPGLSIEFMPGTYQWPRQGFSQFSNLASFCLKGCCAGPAYLRFRTGLRLRKCLGVSISDLHIIIENANSALRFGGGKDITIRGSTVHRDASATQPMLRLRANRRIDLDENRFVLENRNALKPPLPRRRIITRRIVVARVVGDAGLVRRDASGAAPSSFSLSENPRMSFLSISAARAEVGVSEVLVAATPQLTQPITVYPCVQIVNADARTVITNTLMDGHLVLGDTVPSALEFTAALVAIIQTENNLGTMTGKLPALSNGHLSSNSCRIGDCQIMGIVPGRKEIRDLIKWSKSPGDFVSTSGDTPPAFRHLYVENTEFERGDSLIHAGFVNLSGNRIERFGKLQAKSSAKFREDFPFTKERGPIGEEQLPALAGRYAWPLAAMVVASRANYDGNWGFFQQGKAQFSRLPVIADVSATFLLTKFYLGDTAGMVLSGFRYGLLPIDVEYMDLV